MKGDRASSPFMLLHGLHVYLLLTFAWMISVTVLEKHSDRPSEMSARECGSHELANARRVDPVSFRESIQ